MGLGSWQCNGSSEVAWKSPLTMPQDGLSMCLTSNRGGSSLWRRPIWRPGQWLSGLEPSLASSHGQFRLPSHPSALSLCRLLGRQPVGTNSIATHLADLEPMTVAEVPGGMRDSQCREIRCPAHPSSLPLPTDLSSHTSQTHSNTNAPNHFHNALHALHRRCSKLHIIRISCL